MAKHDVRVINHIESLGSDCCKIRTREVKSDSVMGLKPILLLFFANYATKCSGKEALHSLEDYGDGWGFVESGEVGGSHGGGDHGVSHSPEEDKHAHYAGSFYDYVYDQLGGGDDKEYGANGGRSYGSSFEGPSYASAEGAFDLTPDGEFVESGQEDGPDYPDKSVLYADDSDYAGNDTEEGGSNDGGIHGGSDREGGGGGTGDSIGENVKSYFQIKIWSLLFSEGSKLDEAVKDLCIEAGYHSLQKPKLKLRGTRSGTGLEQIGTYLQVRDQLFKTFRYVIFQS